MVLCVSSISLWPEGAVVTIQYIHFEGKNSSRMDDKQIQVKSLFILVERLKFVEVFVLH